MGGCHSEACDTIAKEIWAWAMDRNIWLSAAHTTGKQNVVADKLSRTFNMAVEWQLHPTVFERITAAFSPPSIDLFASRIYHQFGNYVSWKPDPSELLNDAFTIDWAQFTNSYAFPFFLSLDACRKLCKRKRELSSLCQSGHLRYGPLAFLAYSSTTRKCFKSPRMF